MEWKYDYITLIRIFRWTSSNHSTFESGCFSLLYICQSYVVHLLTFNFEGNKAWKSGGVIKGASSISAPINRVFTKGGWLVHPLLFARKNFNHSLHPVSLPTTHPVTSVELSSTNTSEISEVSRQDGLRISNGLWHWQQGKPSKTRVNYA